MNEFLKFSFKQKNRTVSRQTQIYAGNKQAFRNRWKQNDIRQSLKKEKYVCVDDKNSNNSHTLLFEGLTNDVTRRWSILFGQFPKNDARTVAKRAIYLRIRGVYKHPNRKTIDLKLETGNGNRPKQFKLSSEPSIVDSFLAYFFSLHCC